MTIIRQSEEDEDEEEEEMKPFTCLVFVFTLAIASNQTVADQPMAIEAIQEACRHTKHKELCISTLQSNTSGLALVALELACSNASDMSKHIQILFNDPRTASPEYQQSLFDCMDLYFDASRLLDGSVSALLEKAYVDVRTSVGAAIMDGQSCEFSFGIRPSILSHENKVFVQLCEIAISLVDLLGG